MKHKHRYVVPAKVTCMDGVITGLIMYHSAAMTSKWTWVFRRVGEVAVICCGKLTRDQTWQHQVCSTRQNSSTDAYHGSDVDIRGSTALFKTIRTITHRFRTILNPLRPGGRCRAPPIDLRGIAAGTWTAVGIFVGRVVATRLTRGYFAKSLQQRNSVRWKSLQKIFFTKTKNCIANKRLKRRAGIIVGRCTFLEQS